MLLLVSTFTGVPLANVTCATATTIASLPADLSVTRDASSTELWWKYTTGPNEYLLSVVVSSNGTHNFRFGDGSCAAFNNFFTQDKAVHMVQVVPNTTYFLQVLNMSAGATAIRVRLESKPTKALVDGALIVPSVFGVIDRATVLHPTTGEVLHVVLNFPDGLAGDSLGDRALQQDGNDVVLYDAQLGVRARLTGFYSQPLVPNSISANQTTRTFWTAKVVSSVQAVIRTVSAEGVIGARSWTLTTTGNLQGLLPNKAETILYWTESGTTVLHRHDLVNNVPLSDLVASVGAGWSVIRSMFLLSDDTIVLGVRKTAAPISGQVKRYNASGTLLTTYDLDTQDPLFLLDALGRSLDGLSVWVWSEKPGGGLENPVVQMRFRRVRMTDLTVPATFRTSDFDMGVSADHWVEPPQMFGPDSTAIFWPVGVPCVPELPSGACWSPHDINKLQVRLAGL